MSDNDFELDGAGMLDALLVAKAAADDKDDIKPVARTIKIFHKYGLTTLQGFAMLLELLAASGEK